MSGDTGRGLLDLLRELPSTDRGRRHAMTAIVPAVTIRAAVKVIDDTRLDKTIETWLCKDSPARARRVGRPETVPPRAFLVAFMALALARSPISLLAVHHVLTGDMRYSERQALGLPVSSNRAVNEQWDKARRKIGYQAVARTAAKIARTFDPQPFPGRRALTDEQIDEIVAKRDPADVIMRQNRAEQLQATMLLYTFHTLPENTRAEWNGDITLDATVVPIWGRFGHDSKKRKAGAGAVSPEVNAGWHAKDPDKRDQANLEKKRNPDDKEWTFGYDAHLALMTSPGQETPPPALVLGLSLDRPGFVPGINAAHALAGIKHAGLPVGKLITDLGYSQLAVENYALPTRALGYELVSMVKSTELGKIQATYNGLIVVEGTVYCSCLPDTLRNANKEFHEFMQTPGLKKKEIDDAVKVRDLRVKRREFYAARRKTSEYNPDGTLRSTWIYRKPIGCCGTDPKVRLKHKAPAKVACGGKCGNSIICGNSESVSVPADQFIRYVTAVPYKSAEWGEYYTSPRNEMEGRNGLLKNALGVNIESPGERRFRGWGKQFLALTIKLVASNIQAVVTWLDNREHPPAKKARKARSDKREELTAHQVQPNGPPLRIVGHPEPFKRQAA